ncbi:unnamed protein product [Meloidogyne enterolobii]|uniref:Uncharacterized protein n=1 Tax=Meloidogyne enterolobii TaxID=390850 RepID=A0ACB1B022_MELEN
MSVFKIVIVLLFAVLWNEIDCTTRRGRNSRTQGAHQPTEEAQPSGGDDGNTQTANPNRVTNARTHLGNVALLARRLAEMNQRKGGPQYDQHHNAEDEQTRQNEPGEELDNPIGSGFRIREHLFDGQNIGNMQAQLEWAQPSPTNNYSVYNPNGLNLTVDLYGPQQQNVGTSHVRQSGSRRTRRNRKNAAPPLRYGYLAPSDDEQQ